MFGEDVIEISPQNTNAKNKNKLSYYYLHKVTKNSIMRSYCCIKNLYIFMLICHILVICVTFECLEASQQTVKSTRSKVTPERVALLVLSALLAAAVVALCVTSECAQFSD